MILLLAPPSTSNCCLVIVAVLCSTPQTLGWHVMQDIVGNTGEAGVCGGLDVHCVKVMLGGGA